jgi:hypothetical protein
VSDAGLIDGKLKKLCCRQKQAMAKLKWDKAQDDNAVKRQGSEYVAKEFHIPKGNQLHCPYCIKYFTDTELSAHIARYHKHQPSGVRLKKGVHREEPIAAPPKKTKESGPKVVQRAKTGFNTPFEVLDGISQRDASTQSDSLKGIKITKLKRKKIDG